MTTVVQENNHSPSAQKGSSKIPPSMLLIGKKRTLDYLAPALFRINNTGEVVIKATGIFSIVTAVDVAEMVKHDVENLATKSITVGTDELMVSTGERKRMSCIEIHLIKINPTTVATEPATKDISTQAPIVKKTITVVAEEPAAAPVTVGKEEQTEEKKPNARRKSATTIQTAKKKRSTTTRKKKSQD
jgi:DNA-binding protein Alba